ncbi:alpha/beta hydrolase [Streptomyces sp. CT34]|uniref:alpha/beta fold hydrolase n=1 Tax=Streptomyces sp. CT34 TaxID=1553907 RepID=UPI0005B86B5C|nr:alpha/beta hydrolase [Streptomyces sp. CT34]
MAVFEESVGRYVHLDIGGRDHRLFFEEAGAGMPLLCLHTAGSDARQYRHLLADPEVTRRFRVIAFDLPWHGRSLPPDGWWHQEYLLTTERYVETVLAFLAALELDRPILLGCSMAGVLVLELARRHGPRLGGVIGVSGATTYRGRFEDWSLRPDLNAQQSVASWTYGLMAPQSPESARREVWWGYSQGGPGVYRGDTYFFSEDLDLRGRELEIDTEVCPVHLLTGEYDHACTPEGTEATVRAMPGATGGRMPSLGHFPMTENYPLFRTHLIPALTELAGRRTPGEEPTP